MLQPAEDAVVLDENLAHRLIDAFARGSGHGLLQLGAGEVKTELPPVFVYWKEFASRYVTALCLLPDSDGKAAHSVPPPHDLELEVSAVAAPPMPGAEYVSAS